MCVVLCSLGGCNNGACADDEHAPGLQKAAHRQRTAAKRPHQRRLWRTERSPIGDGGVVNRSIWISSFFSFLFTSAPDEHVQQQMDL